MGCNTSQDMNARTPTDSLDVSKKEENAQKSSANIESVPADDDSYLQHVEGIYITRYNGSPIPEISTKNKENDVTTNEIQYNDNIIQKSSVPIDILGFKESNHIVDEDKAAIKIQAVYRGHKVRNMKKSEGNSAVATPNKTEMDDKLMAAKDTAMTENTENSDPTKEELEAEFDPNDKELCDAALKIQATFRGHLSRKLAGNKDAEDVDIQEITKKVAEELDIDLTDPELNKAATKIQASFRGHKSRKDLPAN